jgi:putative cell wall-binding protein
MAALAALLTVCSALLLAAPSPAHAAGHKVAIIVGPVGSLTPSYIEWAEHTAATAAARGATVARAYSPNATAANVLAAVADANIVIYYGHGSGFPNPYSATLDPNVVNGWGLQGPNAHGTHEDNWANGTLRYYGEAWITANARPAPNFVMIYSNACYAPGASEPGHPNATFDQARARVGYYSRGVLGMGAAAYFATDFWQGAATLVSQILDHPTKPFGEIFAAEPQYSASALQTMAHPNVAGRQVWLHRAGNWAGDVDYWYAFAGDPSATPGGIVPSRITVERLSGPDRYATAAAISEESFDPGVAAAYVATGANFPDALAGGPAAASDGAPLLLVSADSIPAATAAELARLRPWRIVILGSAGVVSDDVAGLLWGYQTGGGVSRLEGPDRYATAADISAETFDAGVPLAYVATGENFPDALAGGAAGALQGAPVLLVTYDEIPAATEAELARLAPARIAILGSSGVVSDTVRDELVAYQTGGGVTRLYGSDRYATAVAVTSVTYATNGPSVVYIATGENFPDGLAADPVAGIAGAPLLLVSSGGLPPVVASELVRLDPDRVVLLGGPGVVTESVANQIRALFPVQ